MDNRDVRLLSVENEALLTCNFTSGLQTCVKDHGDSSSRFQEEGFDQYVSRRSFQRFWWYRPLKMATTVYERVMDRGEKKHPPIYVPTGTYRTVFSFPELLNFAVDPENHTETYSGLSYKPAGNLTTLTTSVRSLPPRTFLNRHQVQLVNLGVC